MVEIRDIAEPFASSAPTLAEIKEKTLKPVDAWWTVIVIDPIAVRLLWLLVRITPRLKPSSVTLGSLGFGLMSAALFLTGRAVLGALAYQIAFLLDCVDGKLSRLRGISSPSGAFLDGICGTVVYGVAVLGLILSPTLGLSIPIMALGAALLFVSGISYFASIYVEQPVEGVHAPFVARSGSWLQRHRLLPPGAFPERHALLFVLGPLTGEVAGVLLVVLLLEMAVVIAKIRKVFRQHDAPSTTGSVP